MATVRFGVQQLQRTAIMLVIRETGFCLHNTHMLTSSLRLIGNVGYAIDVVVTETDVPHHREERSEWRHHIFEATGVLFHSRW